MTPVRERTRALAAAIAFIAIPGLVALVEATGYHVANRSTRSIVSSGVPREFLIHVPERIDPGTPVPLVISMHGGALWPAAQMQVTGWNEVADEHGFIVVYPAGQERPKRWGTFAVDGDLGADVRFIADLIDTVRAEYAIDTTRIYADGLSNGGGMAFLLSCTLADRIAAVGLVAPAQTLPRAWCPDPRPMPMMGFHGDADPILPYGGGPMGSVTPVRPVFRPVLDLVSRWAERNGCDAVPREAPAAPDVMRLAYDRCTDGAAVVFYTIVGGGHTWPGGAGIPQWFAGPTTSSIDATRELWGFFRQYRRVWAVTPGERATP